MPRLKRDEKGIWRVYGLADGGKEILLGPKSGEFGHFCVASVPVLTDGVGFRFSGPEDESAQDIMLVAEEWEKKGDLFGSKKGE